MEKRYEVVMLLLLITMRQSVHECTQKLFQFSELPKTSVQATGVVLCCSVSLQLYFFGIGARVVYHYKLLQLVQVTLNKHTSTLAWSIEQDTRHGAVSLYPVHLT